MSEPYNEFAFPFVREAREQFSGMTLRDYFAIRAPEPAQHEIESEARSDMLANPHGEHNKPPRRSANRIRADLRYEYADAMLRSRATTPSRTADSK